MDNQDLKNRFQYHEPRIYQRGKYAFVSDKGRELAEVIDEMVQDCRGKDRAITKVEEAVFWANAGITRNP